MFLWKLYDGKDYKIKPTLERIKNAAKELNNPQKNYFSFIIGGTNGKGSTCAFLNNLILKAGNRVGWFVSPHLVSENERIRVNSVPIDERELELYVKDLKKLFEKYELTYFEAVTLIALKYFVDNKVEYAVWEVGMGGRWDATRVSESKIACLTNVGKDHMKWLGNTVDLIAIEKLEIARNVDTFCVGSMRFPIYPFALKLEKEEKFELVAAGIDYEYYGTLNKDHTLLKSFKLKDFKIEDIKLSLWGKRQLDNAALSLSAFLSSPIKKDKELIKNALESTYWEGRMEILRKTPLILVDGAHNEDAVIRSIKEVYEFYKNIRIVFSSLKDKEWKKELSFVRKFFDEITLVPINYKRAESIDNLKSFAVDLGFKVSILESVKDILSLKEDAFVFGSLYLIGELKALINLNINT